jgi:hypothetical protein
MTSIVGRLARKTKRLRKDGVAVLGQKEQICSHNTKTGYSVNFPICGTCRPTSVCAELCYGAKPGRPITWDNSVLKNLRVHDYFLKTHADDVADRLHDEYVRRKMTFLRWNGVGDLFPESVHVINRIAVRYPDMVLWIATRIPEMARMVTRRGENIYLQFSLDGSDECRKRRGKIALSRHPRLYYSFLRRSMDEDTMGARIVYNAQQYKKHLICDDRRTVCPADADMLKIKGACEKCRMCFSRVTLDGTQHRRT